MMKIFLTNYQSKKKKTEILNHAKVLQNGEA